MQRSPAGAQGPTSAPRAGRPLARLPRPPAGALGLHLRPEDGPAAGSHTALPGWSPWAPPPPRGRADRWLACGALRLEPRAPPRPEGGPAAGSPAALSGWSPGLHRYPEGGPAAGSPAALSG
eukprot:tig00000836_g4714.t1